MVFYYSGQNGVSGNSRQHSKLKEAATKKADESILIEIADKDLALKVKYLKKLINNS